jgi:hypothetical protein
LIVLLSAIGGCLEAHAQNPGPNEYPTAVPALPQDAVPSRADDARRDESPCGGGPYFGGGHGSAGTWVYVNPCLVVVLIDRLSGNKGRAALRPQDEVLLAEIERSHALLAQGLLVY